MPYYPLGYPDLETSIDVAQALAGSGADMIELGLSFSDPLADGPVIQNATQIALQNGISIRKSLDALSAIRGRGVNIPLVLMGYYNPILAYGLKKFVSDALRLGADGFIIPDLPLEESAEFSDAIGDSGMPLIRMLAPTCSPERMQSISAGARGFIYLVSVTGVTGARQSVANGLADLIGSVRHHTDLPVCVGFGISTPEQARAVGMLADGVIVGSACVRAIGNSDTPVETARAFARSFHEALI